MQSIVVYIIFGIALVYAGWKIYKSITHKEKVGCSKCEGMGNTPTISGHPKD